LSRFLLLLTLEDGQLAWLADPSTSQTPVILNKQAPHPQLRGLRLSPGGRQVALVDGRAVYVYPIP
jgi:hypothetical protein